MYPENIKRSLEAVRAARSENISCEPARMTQEKKEYLLLEHHPDHAKAGFSHLSVGASKGERVPTELCELLQSRPRIDARSIDLSHPRHDVDVLVIGGGGAGCVAAIEASNAGVRALIATKSFMGDANTIMAEGGIQAADKDDDSPLIHFIDTLGGGNFISNRELVSKLVHDAPEAIRWLIGLGVEFDRDAHGNLVVNHGGGTSRKRVHSAKDLTGLEIMRTLRDEVKDRKIPILEYTAAIELILDESGRAAGAVLMDMNAQEVFAVRAGAVVLATGGSGRMHYGGFNTSNHYGATADGLVLGYRAGAKLIHAHSLQYHPTGAAFPPQLAGSLVTEKARSLGARLINVDGEVFVHPLETRDVTAASIIRECKERGKGVSTPIGAAVWLDIPMIDEIHGAGTIKNQLTGIFKMFERQGIDVRKEPILVYPTLHYQNGGLEITPDAMTSIKGLFAAGEVTGGIHGTNRLMGNSLLDVVVFGRIAGQNAATEAKGASLGSPTLSHVSAFEAELAQSGIHIETTAPLLFPNYDKNA